MVLKTIHNILETREKKRFEKEMEKAKQAMEKYRETIGIKFATYTQSATEEPPEVTSLIDAMAFHYNVTPEDIRKSELYNKILEIYRRSYTISQVTPEKAETNLHDWAVKVAQGFCRRFTTSKEEFDKCVERHSARLEAGMKKYITGSPQMNLPDSEIVSEVCAIMTEKYECPLSQGKKDLVEMIIDMYPELKEPLSNPVEREWFEKSISGVIEAAKKGKFHKNWIKAISGAD